MAQAQAKPSKTADKRAKAANKALYAPRQPAPLPAPKPRVQRLVPDAVLARVTRRALDELRMPGKVPSEVIRAALDEVLSLAEKCSVNPKLAHNKG